MTIFLTRSGFTTTPSIGGRFSVLRILRWTPDFGGVRKDILIRKGTLPQSGVQQIVLNPSNTVCFTN